MRFFRSSIPRDSSASAPASASAAASAPRAQAAHEAAHGWLRRAGWFVALWCAGVAGALLLALPFRLLMHAAMR
ncbi:DUF2474 family protein [Paraburkholderia sp. BCC1885]|uniref:DUF2474 family protein n=1 Tax=Paraburkholderia sp. BCC1885 TaxID=2562669 RepID=UPI001183A9DB|nr:DUF2474 family protein [Paraburkholderia sp. BCC1885]